jgi:hypothetical protein
VPVPSRPEAIRSRPPACAVTCVHRLKVTEVERDRNDGGPSDPPWNGGPARSIHSARVRPPPSGAQDGAPDRLCAVDGTPLWSKTAMIAVPEVSADAAVDQNEERKSQFRATCTFRDFIVMQAYRGRTTLGSQFDSRPLVCGEVRF